MDTNLTMDSLWGRVMGEGYRVNIIRNILGFKLGARFTGF